MALMANKNFPQNPVELKVGAQTAALLKGLHVTLCYRCEAKVSIVSTVYFLSSSSNFIPVLVKSCRKQHQCFASSFIAFLLLTLAC